MRDLIGRREGRWSPTRLDRRQRWHSKVRNRLQCEDDFFAPDEAILYHRKWSSGRDLPRLMSCSRFYEAVTSQTLTYRSCLSSFIYLLIGYEPRPYVSRVQLTGCRACRPVAFHIVIRTPSIEPKPALRAPRSQSRTDEIFLDRVRSPLQI